MGTEPIEALQVALKQVASQVASLGLNSIIDSNGTHRIARCEWALRTSKVSKRIINPQTITDVAVKRPGTRNMNDSNLFPH